MTAGAAQLVRQEQWQQGQWQGQWQEWPQGQQGQRGTTIVPTSGTTIFPVGLLSPRLFFMAWVPWDYYFSPWDY